MDGYGFDDVDLATVRARRTLKWSRHGPDVLAAWVAEMDFPTAPVIVDALAESIQHERFGYPTDEHALPEAYAAWAHARHGWDVDPDRIHMVPDVLRGVALALEHGTPVGSQVVLPTPMYMPFFDLIPMVGREIVEVPYALDRAAARPALDLARIDDAFAAGARSMILCNPANPVGRSFSGAELADLASLVEQHAAYVVSDEIHAPLTYEPAIHVPYASVSPAAAAHSITLTSASKGWNLPGLKCALAITTSDRDLSTWRNFTLEAEGATTLGIDASIAAFTVGGRWLDAVLAYLDGTRRWLPDLLAAHLPGVRWTPPDATYLAWIDCAPLGLSGDPSAFFLREARVAVNEGRPFGTGFDDFIRLNFATSRAILERIVTAMGEAVAGRRAG